MKIIILYTVVLLLATTVFGQDKSILEGKWFGTLDAGGAQLQIVLNIAKESGGYTAKFDIVEQGAKDLPMDEITLKDEIVKFSVAKFGFGYEGKLNKKADEINGTFTQGGNALPLNFKRTNETAVRKRPQTPVKPYPYTEEEVGYKNLEDNVKLVGTLTLPPEKGKFPAVILITGSGAQDRDETIFEHRPFLVLADYLTRRGIAVLRVDDRGIGGSDAGSPRATTENYVGDVLSGVAYLKSRAEINHEKIGLIGHSEGGIIAPIAAVRSKDVAFIVMLAGTGQSGEDILISQITAILKADGAPEKEIAESVELQKNLFTIIKSEPDDRLTAQKIGEMLEKRKSKMNAQELKKFAASEKNIKAGMPALLSSWYRWFLTYNPRPTLEKVKVPVLAINGENDTQVPAKKNLEIISAALKSGGNKNFTVKSFPKLNHLFQTSQTGLLREYGEIEETISPVVLETISNWILKYTIVK